MIAKAGRRGAKRVNCEVQIVGAGARDTRLGIQTLGCMLEQVGTRHLKDDTPDAVTF